MKKIMILGGSSLQLPAIQKAKEKGLYVIVIDYDKDALGFKYADLPLLISTIDIDRVYEAAIKYKPDYIMTCTSDMPVRTVAYINEKLGKKLDISYNDSLRATNKAYMRRRLKAFNVPIPSFYIVDSESEYLEAVSHFKDDFISKPADNAASRGVCLGHRDGNELSYYEYSKACSRSGTVMVEEYMVGKEVSVESFTVNHKTEIITITDKIITGPPHFVEIGHSEPSALPNELQNQIKKITLQAIKAINVINGPTHTEVCITESGPKIVEIAARLGGDFITSKLVPLSTGVDMVENSLLSTINQPVDLKHKCSRKSAIRFIPTKLGTISIIKGIDEAKSIPNIDEILIYKSVGDSVGNISSSNDRVGHIIASGDNAEEVENALNKALECIHVEYK